MTKLTVAMRDAIVEKAVEKAGLKKEAIALAERRKVWAEKVADESVGGAEAVAKLNEANKKIARIMATLPKDLQEDLRAGPLTGSILAAFGGRRVYVNHWDGRRPAKDGLMLAADHPLTVEFEALETIEDDLKDRRDKLKHDVRAMVNSVTTVARLLAVWPEAKELIPTYATQPKNLPAVNIDNLNAAIGLPTEETQEQHP